MSARGRPIRFVGLVCMAWVGVRVALLWPQTGSLPDAIEALIPLARKPAVASPVMSVAVPLLPLKLSAKHPDRRARAMIVVDAAAPILVAQPASMTRPLASLSPPPTRVSDAFEPPQETMQQPMHASHPDRWSASGWLVARGGRGTGAAPGGQLGGGQAGVRIGYLLAPRQRISLFARGTAPLAGKGSEAAVGIEWQPWKAPVRFAIERRIGVDGATGGTGAGVVAGLYRETQGFRLEGYGQAGGIWRARIDPYADGAVRVTRPALPRLSLGAGAWGGAQRGARRLDIGPSATLSLGKARLSLDWRQRIAGRARPGSGLALTLGGDF